MLKMVCFTGSRARVVTLTMILLAGCLTLKQGKWLAHIRVNGKERQIGTFLTIDEAVKARKNAEEINGYHDNHGRDIYVDLPYIDPWNRIN